MRPAQWAALAGAGALLGMVLWRARFSEARAVNESAAEALGRGTVETVIDVIRGGGKAAGRTVKDALMGAGRGLEAAIWPAAKCAQAMAKGDAAAVLWACDPATGAEWLTSGRPRDCRAISGNRVQCRPAKTGGASGSW